jgi:hypothetical protein
MVYDLGSNSWYLMRDAKFCDHQINTQILRIRFHGDSYLVGLEEFPFNIEPIFTTR